MKNQQFAALPYRMDQDGPRILLITTRGKGKWLIPKGWPMKGRKPSAAAAVEAFEEAGVLGKVARRSVGRFTHRKSVGSRAIDCTVSVFPLEVRRKLKRWPECKQRKRRWFKGKKAASLIDAKGLRRAIRDLAEEQRR
jgi:8-oxo-dGTP pyrophosphatase MutT (NUDIX family)